MDLQCLEDDIVASQTNTDEFNDLVNFVREESKLRQLDEACLSTRSQIGTYSSEDLVGEMMQKLVTISIGQRDTTFTPVDKLFDGTFGDLQTGRGDSLIGFPTSVGSLDQMIGGWQPQKLYCVAGRPGMGKTAFAVQSACRLAYHENVPVCFFSIEMPERELMERIIANLTGIEYWRISKRLLKQEHLDTIADYRERIIQMPLYICDSGSLTLSMIIAKVKALKMRIGDLGPVFLDYLQLMKIPIPRGGNRDIAIGETTRALKELTKTQKVPVIILSQVKRAVEERTNSRPTLADLRESGNIEQDTDAVIFIYRDWVYSQDPAAEKDCELILPKIRASKVGTLEIGLDLDFQHFYDR